MPKSCGDCSSRARSCFASITQSEDFEKVSGAKSESTLHPGMNISFAPQSGSPGSGFYCLEKGYVRKFTELANGTTGILCIAGPGDLIGYQVDGEAGESSRQAEALEKSSACFFMQDKFEQLQRDIPAISHSLVKVFARRLNSAYGHVLGLENHSVTSRVAALLFSLAEQSGVTTELGSRIRVKLDRDTMAKMAGTVTETFARVLTQLEKEKVILRQGRAIIITNFSLLDRARNFR